MRAYLIEDEGQAEPSRVPSQLAHVSISQYQVAFVHRHGGTPPPMSMATIGYMQAKKIVFQ
jgi:hypothetical protein